MNKLKKQNRLKNANGGLDTHVINVARVSTEEKMKELALQKEETELKKVIVQMVLMKGIQKKTEENKKLELALEKLVERRVIINAALKQQKQTSNEKNRLALQKLERQKKLMQEKEESMRHDQEERMKKQKRLAKEEVERQMKIKEEREQLILRIKSEEEAKQHNQAERLKKQRQDADEKRKIAQKEMERKEKFRQERKELILRMKEKKKSKLNIQEEVERRQKQKILGPDSINKNKVVNEKIQILDVHKLLVKQSNKRILDRMKEIKLGRQKDTVVEQEQLEDELTPKKTRLRKDKRKMRFK